MLTNINDKVFNKFFEYDEFNTGVFLVNFYKHIKNEILGIEQKVDVDYRKIKISKELYMDMNERMIKIARDEGYPDSPTKDKPQSASAPALVWMNQGPSVDDNLDKYEIVIEDKAMVPSKGGE